MKSRRDFREGAVPWVSPVYSVRPAQGYEWFLRFFLDLPQTREVINPFCSGSVRQSLSFKDLAAIPVVLPPKEIAAAFTSRPKVRDTLLPKVMSGEVRTQRVDGVT